MDRATSLTDNGEHDKAIKDYSEAIAIRPEDDGAYFARGIAYSRKGEHGKALADYSRAIALNPKWPWPTTTAGTATRIWENTATR